MGNRRFFDRPPGLTVAEIVSLTGAESSDPNRLSHLIRDVAPMDLAVPPVAGRARGDRRFRVTDA